MILILRKNIYYDYFWNQIDYHNVYNGDATPEDIKMEGMATKYTIKYV